MPRSQEKGETDTEQGVSVVEEYKIVTSEITYIYVYNNCVFVCQCACVSE